MLSSQLIMSTYSTPHLCNIMTGASVMLLYSVNLQISKVLVWPTNITTTNINNRNKYHRNIKTAEAQIEQRFLVERSYYVYKTFSQYFLIVLLDYKVFT